MSSTIFKTLMNPGTVPTMANEPDHSEPATLRRSGPNLLQVSAQFRKDVAQVRARAALSEIADQADEARIASWRWSLHPEALARQTVALQAALGATTMHQEAGDPLAEGAQIAALVAARAWEGIAGLRDGIAKLGPLLSAAVDYELAGYQANAACLARNAEHLTQLVDPPTLEFLAAIFLQRQFLRFTALAEPLSLPPDARLLARLGEPARSNEAPSDDLLARVAARLLAIRGLLKARRYFLSGDDDAFAEALDLISHARTGFSTVGAISDSNLAGALTAVLPEMRDRSIWRWLRPILSDEPVWQRYLRLLARGVGRDVSRARSLSELWPSQLEAIQSGVLSDNSNKVIRMPTGAGKTRVAELAIVHQLVKDPNSRCLYIAPFRALADEVEEALESSLSDLGFGVTALVGGAENAGFESVVAAQDHVLVLTPEKADLLSRISPEVIAAVRLVVLDEGHIVGDLGRGIGYEMLISRLRLAVPQARLLFLSAVVPDETLREFTEWLSAGQAIESTWRPAVQRLARLEWQGPQGVLRFESLSDELAMEKFLPSVIRERKFEYVNPRTKRRNSRRFPDPSNKAQVAAALAFALLPTGPVLIFCAQPNLAEAVGKALQVRLELANSVGEGLPPALQGSDVHSAAVAEEWLGPAHIATQLLRASIAIHHGRLPDAVRSAVEEDFRAGKLRVVVATSTLAQGVNLPVRTVIMHSVWRYSEAGQVRLDAREYWNIAGRAGRAGHETNGLTIHITKDRKDERDFRFFADHRGAVERVRGALLELLRDLVAERITVDDAGELLDASILPLLVEEVGEHVAPLLDRLDSVVRSSLVAHQAATDRVDLGSLLGATREAGTKILKGVPSAPDRLLFSGTGLSSTSCMRIASHADENVSTLRGCLMGQTSRDSLMSVIIDGLSSVTEMDPIRPFPGDFSTLTTLWLNGHSVVSIIQNFREETGLDVSAETVSEFVSDYEMYRLPWGASAYIQIAADRLGLEADELPLEVRSIPALLKFGVPSVVAAWSVAFGVSSRPLAIALGTLYEQEDGEQEPRAVRAWLGRQDAEQLGRRLSATGSALVDLGRACQRSRRADVGAALSTDGLLPLSVTVEPIDDEEGAAGWSQFVAGAKLHVKRDYDSTVDRNRMIVTVDDRTIGVIPPAVSQLLAVELDTGLEISVSASMLANSDTPKLHLVLDGDEPF